MGIIRDEIQATGGRIKKEESERLFISVYISNKMTKVQINEYIDGIAYPRNINEPQHGQCLMDASELLRNSDILTLRLIYYLI